MFKLFRTIKMATTGKVLHQIDNAIQGGNCTLSLRLKQERSGASYVVLAGVASGNHQYFPMEGHEFLRFADSVAEIRKLLAATSETTVE